LAVLAAFGVRTLLRAVGRTPVKLALAAVLAFVVVSDLEYPFVPNPVGSLPSYDALRDQPPGIAAELPMMPANQDLSQATFYQQRHGKRIVNGYREGTLQEARATGLNDLSSKKVLSGLRAIGVKYLLVRQDTDIVGWPKVPEPRAKDVTLLKADPAMKLYRLKPGFGTLALWFRDLGAIETGTDGKPLQWSQGDDVELNLATSCVTCTKGTVTFTLQPFGGPRTLTFTGAGLNGRKETIAPGITKVGLPVTLRDGRADIDVAISPGPVPIPSVIAGSTDTRSFSVGLGEPTLEVDR
ncbi:MAG: hypothetical protein Q7T55_26620, partial [Solirubrobacteraceae bacterium]|nr:hypothetical protein [Solirubrobacteraceae bacterium]